MTGIEIEKQWAELLKDETSLFFWPLLGIVKLLNSDGFCQLFNTKSPSPLCHSVIISSTPSLRCLLPSAYRHITKHTQWHCAFSHHHFWHSMRRHPHPRHAPLGAFLMCGVASAWALIERFIMLSKRSNAQHSQGQRAVALEYRGCCGPAIANPGCPLSAGRSRRGDWPAPLPSF